MASCPETELGLPLSGKGILSPALVPALSITVCALGLATIWPTMVVLWSMWTSDALESIGIFVPVVSLILIGLSTSLYLVPLYSLLQYSAPKGSKGMSVATNNFTAVIGAIVG